MNKIIFLTHPNVKIDPDVPVPEWGLSDVGIKRMELFSARMEKRAFSAVWSSHEQKALEAAKIFANRSGLPIKKSKELAENDRSSTGYLEKDAFEAHANRFFASPHESIEGWERAVDAQKRIVRAVTHINDTEKHPGNILIVAHGAVGALLMGHLKYEKISRSLDQPGGGGGCMLTLQRRPLSLIEEWRLIEDIHPLP